MLHMQNYIAAAMALEKNISQMNGDVEKDIALIR